MTVWHPTSISVSPTRQSVADPRPKTIGLRGNRQRCFRRRKSRLVTVFEQLGGNRVSAWPAVALGFSSATIVSRQILVNMPDSHKNRLRIIAGAGLALPIWGASAVGQARREQHRHLASLAIVPGSDQIFGILYDQGISRASSGRLSVGLGLPLRLHPALVEAHTPGKQFPCSAH